MNLKSKVIIFLRSRLKRYALLNLIFFFFFICITVGTIWLFLNQHHIIHMVVIVVTFCLGCVIKMYIFRKDRRHVSALPDGTVCQIFNARYLRAALCLEKKNKKKRTDDLHFWAIWIYLIPLQTKSKSLSYWGGKKKKISTICNVRWLHCLGGSVFHIVQYHVCSLQRRSVVSPYQHVLHPTTGAVSTQQNCE